MHPRTLRRPASRRRFAIFAMLAVAGTLVPLVPFASWVGDHGIDPRRFVADLFANRVSAFFGLDVILSAVTLVIFVLVDGRQRRVRHMWVPIAATFCVGVSCGFPLYLAMRERADLASH